MNKAAFIIPTLISVGVGYTVNFLILRTVLRKTRKPRDSRQQLRLAAVLAGFLSVPALLRIRQLEAFAARPADR